MPPMKWPYKDVYAPAADRYETMTYNRCGRSGLDLPALSLGLWRNYGDNRPLDGLRAVYRAAFDAGITHFDFANNYGIPFGSAEANFGRIMREDFAPYRDEIVVATKAGWEMWPGPYGNWGSRKYLLSSLDQSLERMNLEYVDIYYSHRADPQTPLEETIGALDAAVRSGKALYAGISMYNAERTKKAAKIARELGTPLLIHQASYSMLNRWIEADLLDVVEGERMGLIGFSPLAQGMLSDKYLDGIPTGSRASENRSLQQAFLSEENLSKIRSLNEIAKRRGQSLVQMALAWALRDPRVDSVLIGVRDVEQLNENLKTLENLEFSEEELKEIDSYATEGGINIWGASLEVS